jgi:UDP-N-acetylglucosamine--N-acetylmuramyl-(pentapeptide) pyrophosphoryl-undecaprenol N-acetylglucosamine transferase
MSISELCLVAKPSIFVPSPNVSEDHQTKNAMALVQKNAALLVRDSEATAQLGDVASKLLLDEAECRKLSQAICALAQNQAAERIVEEMKKLVQ